ncbi:MAG: hypothetical protein AB1942_19945 [Pseudomonadota bacterium]
MKAAIWAGISLLFLASGVSAQEANDLPPGVTPRAELSASEQRQGVSPHAGATAPRATPPEIWKPWIQDYFGRVLKDPYSAMIRQSSVPWLGSFRTGFGSPTPSWAVCYAVNAKNSYGAYVGERFYLFLLTENGAVVRVVPSGDKISQYAQAADQQIATRECATRLPPAPRPAKPAI